MEAGNIENRISAVKGEISAVRNDIENSISAVKGEISDVKTEFRQEISVFQERIRNIEAGQAEFEERVTRNLCEDLSRNIEETRQDFETQLADLEARTRRAGDGNAGANADKVKPPKFDGSTSWVVFHRQFDAAATHNDWTPGEKAAHLLSVLQGQAADVLHSVPAEAPYCPSPDPQPPRVSKSRSPTSPSHPACPSPDPQPPRVSKSRSPFSPIAPRLSKSADH
jgi:hypothetical protein